MALDFPDSPGPGSTYSAPNGVLYTWDNTIGVWTATLDSPSAPFVILDAGSISGTPAVGNTLTYTQGVAGGGTPPLNYSWNWKDDLGNTLQSGGTLYVITPADFGRTIKVELSVTDSATTPVTITGTTASTATVFRNPFPATTWDPTPGDGLDRIPGLISGVYSGAGPTITATGCIEVSTDGTNFSQSEGVTSGDTIYARWIVSPACGGAPTGTDLTGTVTDGTFENDYAITVNRKPFPPLADVSDTGVPLISVTTKSLGAPVEGLNTTAYITLDTASTGSNIQVSTDNGVTYINVPSAPSTAIPVNNGVTLRVRQTVGSTISTGYTAIINIGDSTGETGAVGTYQSVTYTATTTSDPSFPNYNPLPSYAPNASPEGLSIVDTGSLGPLDGTANGSWGDGNNPVTGTNMLLSIGAGAFTSSVTPVNGDTVNIAWDPTYIDGLADQAIASGSISDGVYTNTYTFTVEKNPVYNIPADSASLAPGATATIPTRTPNNYNSPVPFYYTPGTNTMLNVQVDINGNGLQSLPSSLGTALTLTPGDTVEIFADLGPNPTTVYSITINMGAFSGLWSETSQAIPAIAQPTLVAPTGSPPALLDPGLNAPSGITLVSSAYSASGGAGTQTTSTYEVYEGGFPLTSSSTITLVTPAAAPGGSGIQIRIDFTTTPGPAFDDRVYGQIPQTAALTSGEPAGTYPAWEWANSVNVGGGINGFTDWYIPAANELKILYFNLKPTTQLNTTSGGSQVNNNAVPPYTLANYTTTDPPQTGALLFQSPNAETFGPSTYWSGSNGRPNPPFPENCALNFDNGFFDETARKRNSLRVRLIRRIPIADYVAAGSPSVGSFISTAGGYYGGQISTAGDGIADYALIVSPNAQGTYNWTAGTNAKLTISGANADGFVPGLTIIGNTSGATGEILSVSSTQTEYLEISGTFITGETISTDPASYTALTGSPYSGTTPVPPTDPSAFIPVADLTPSENYFWRAQYATNTPSAITSPWSSWNEFATSSSFSVPIGTPMGGGYFGGQIQVPAGTGTIYNLIVAPLIGDTTGPNPSGTLLGQYSTDGGVSPAGIQWSTNGFAASVPAEAQDLEYGGAWTNTAGGTTTTGLGGIYPLFGWCKNSPTGPNGGGGIGGFTDWYIPAQNELEVLYYFLKPNTTAVDANSTLDGSNPNAVAPEPVSTNYTITNPPQTTASLFQASNAEAFTASPTFYWTSSEDSGATSTAFFQSFVSGTQAINGKTTFNYARAIRRVAA